MSNKNCYNLQKNKTSTCSNLTFSIEYAIIKYSKREHLSKTNSLSHICFYDSFKHEYLLLGEAKDILYNEIMNDKNLMSFSTLIKSYTGA